MSELNRMFDPLFNPRSIAVIGASNHWNKWGNSTFSSVLNGFTGNVYPINRKEPEVLGHTAYPTVLDVPDDIDLAIFVIPARGIPEVMEECVRKGVKAGIIISAGFREIGPEGKKLEDEVLRIAQQGGLRFAGPNCMGLWSAPSQLRAYMFPLPSREGPVAFVTQGGNVGGTIVSSAFGRGLGLHKYVSCGPAADIQLEDYVEYFGDDDGVRVIMAYIEGINDGKKFLEKLGRVTLKKPVVVYKPGRHDVSARAILSHSGSLAGSDEIFDTALRKAGAIRVHSPEELLDVSIGFLSHPLPKGRNVAIITGGGSYGVVCAEDCAEKGLNVASLPRSTIENLSTIFPSHWSHGNPIDPAGDRNFLAYYLAPRIIMELEEFDSLIFMGFGSLAGISQLFDKDGPQIFIHRLPKILASTPGIDRILDTSVSILSSGDDALFRQFAFPMIPIVSALIGSDRKTVGEFLDVVLSGSTIRRAFTNLVTSLPHTMEQSRESGPEVQWIFESLDRMVSALLVQYMITFEKPIISTTFSDLPVPIRGGSYPYTTSSKAANVLAKLVEYREYLERHSMFKNPFQCCAFLDTP
ncbi:MAG: acetate--CoA ligase family protein [Desulfomonilia bacterium]